MVVVSHDVTFDERAFPLRKSGQPSATPPQPLVFEGPATIEYLGSEPRGPVPPPPPPPPQTPEIPVPNRDNTIYLTPSECPPPAMPLPRAPLPRIQQWPAQPPNSALPGPSFGLHPQRLSGRLRPNPQPNPHYTGPDNAERNSQGYDTHMALLAAVEYHDLLTYQEVMASNYVDDWCNACQYEIDALAKNGTWDLVDLPAGHKAVKSKWVFKQKADGRFCV
jgi:hypothetical protein